MPRSPDILSAGDDLTAARLLSARTSVQKVIGAGGAAQGLQDGDVPGPIPNQFFDRTHNAVRIGFKVLVPSTSPGGFHPCAVPFPLIGGTLMVATLQGDPALPMNVVIARESGASQDGVSEVVAAFAFAPESGAVSYAHDVAEEPEFKIGDTVIVTTTDPGTLPAVGSKLLKEAFERPAIIDLWFVPEDEPS